MTARVAPRRGLARDHFDCPLDLGEGKVSEMVSTAGKRVSISIPLGSFHLSGGVKVLILLANGMAEKGWEVAFVVPDFASVPPFPVDSRIRITAIPTGPAWFPGKIRRSIYYAKLLTRATEGAGLCLANYYLTAYCAIASTLFNKKPQSRILWYVQGHEAVSHGMMAEDNVIGKVLRYALASLSYRLPVPIFCVSEWVKREIGRADAHVINPPALNLKQFSPEGRHPDPNSLVIGVIGRRGATKGYEDFLSALECLPEGTAIRVLVASPKLREVPLPTRFPAEGIHATTESAMAAFYRRCNVFILPSRMEAFPLPPLEAMACGCAVIVTACGGVVEYTQDGVNGLVVPVRDPKSMARAIHRLCQDSVLRERLSIAGARTVQRYSQEDMVNQFVDLVAERVASEACGANSI